MKWLKNAFALDDGTTAEPNPTQLQAIDRVLHEILRRRIDVPAEMLLETCRPLNYVGGQLLRFFSPAMKIVLGTHEQDEFARFLEHRGSIDFLLERLAQLRESSRAEPS